MSPRAGLSRPINFYVEMIVQKSEEIVRMRAMAAGELDQAVGDRGVR